MKPVSTPSPKGKRKQNISAFFGRSPTGQHVAKRTRSNSSLYGGVEDGNIARRSTRSSSGDTFFELPYYKPLPKKLAHDKRNLNGRTKCFSNTSQFSSSDSSVETGLLMNNARRKTKITRLHQDQIKDDETTVCKTSCLEEHHNKLKLPLSFQVPVNGATQEKSRTVSNTNSSFSTNLALLPMKNGLSNKGLPCHTVIRNGDSVSNNSKEAFEVKQSLSFPGEVFEQFTHETSDTFLEPKPPQTSRKRHLSENDQVLNSMRRMRRLSERGEMASVIELVFNHKKTCAKKNSVSPKKHKKLESHVEDSCSGTTVSPHRTGKKLGLVRMRDRKDVTKPSRSLRSRTGESLSTSSNGPGSAAERQGVALNPSHAAEACDDKSFSKMLTSRHLATDAEKQKYDRSCTSLEAHQAAEVNNTTCGEASLVINNNEDGCDQKFIDDALNTEDMFVKWRRRTLRSSSTSCQPDFSALSLDLMIHRTRKKPKPFVRGANSSSDTELAESKNEDAAESEIKVTDENEFSASVLLDEESKGKLNQEEQQTLSTENASERPDANLLSEGVSPVQSVAANSQAPSKVFPSCSRFRGKIRGKVRGRRKASFSSQPFPTSLKDPLDPPPLFEEEPPSGPDVYYFESDHVALKHNSDYHSVLRVAAMLESLRQQAIKDLDVLDEKLQEALDDPISFVDKLHKKADTGLPKPLRIPQLPQIDWSQYVSQFGTFDQVFSNSAFPSPSKPLTRRKKISFVSGVPSKSAASSSESNSTTTDSSKARSDTFKKPWTVEEQRKLEELLIKHPQEANESNRFRKIAADLGGRTSLQVQSRVQKYFIKLAKAGLPIPGRMPRSDRWLSTKPKRNYPKHKSHPQAALARISTFFADFHVPVKMRDDDEDLPDVRSRDEDDEQGWDAMNSEQVSDEEDIPEDFRYSDEYLEILRLKRQRKELLQMYDKNGQQAMAQHHGYQCDICRLEPIKGIRYHCIDCPTEESVDLCQSCIQHKNVFQTITHKANHRFDPIYAAMSTTADVNDSKDSLSYLGSPRPYTDADYTSSARKPGEYNYLDPNYLPPTG